MNCERQPESPESAGCTGRQHDGARLGAFAPSPTATPRHASTPFDELIARIRELAQGAGLPAELGVRKPWKRYGPWRENRIWFR